MNRYTNQIQLAAVGIQGQEKLSKARVLIVGAGGLGCVIIPYLAGAGVGTIGIIDGDVVEESNLHRQILYHEKDIGQFKTQKAADYLRKFNANVNVEVYDDFLHKGNAGTVIRPYDIVVDATDTIDVRYLINAEAERYHKPVVYASVYQHEAQLSVFNYKGGPTYSCVFGEQVNRAPNCSQGGVLGTTVGIIGIMQANEVIKMIVGAGVVMSGRLLVYNSLTNTQDIFEISKKEKNIETNDQASGLALTSCYGTAREAGSSTNGIIIDLREPDELPKISTSKVKNVPLSTLERFMETIHKDQSIYFLCQRGIRSLSAAKWYRAKGYNVKSIVGGINQFKKYVT